MTNYKNTILLVDYEDNNTEAIIYTNESWQTIGKAIDEAKDEWSKLDGMGFLIYFIEDYLKEKFGDIVFVTDFAILDY